MKDNKSRYGSISRALHWTMALGFGFMLVTSLSRNIDKDSALTKAIFQYHGQVGFTLLLLGVLRLIWVFKQKGNRPNLSIFARSGHALMYALMIVVPLAALGRTLGSGRGFDYLYFIPVLPSSDQKIQWLINLGNTYHGKLGWALFAIMVAHILIAIKNIFLSGGKDNTLPRMLGKK